MNPSRLSEIYYTLNHLLDDLNIIYVELHGPMPEAEKTTNPSPNSLAIINEIEDRIALCKNATEGLKEVLVSSKSTISIGNTARANS